MSTLRVSTISDTTGANQSTPEAIYNGIAKAWVNFKGTGTVEIRDDFNVDNITDNGTGDYRVNLSSSVGTTNYCTVASVCSNGSTNGSVNSVDIYSRNTTNVVTPDTTSYYLYVYHDNNAVAQDADHICAATFA